MPEPNTPSTLPKNFADPESVDRRVSALNARITTLEENDRANRADLERVKQLYHELNERSTR